MISINEIEEILYNEGRRAALALQDKAPTMSQMELYDGKRDIPTFSAACKAKNMLERKAGFVCKSSAGRIVRLLQPYDSTIYTQEPEELLAQWGFVWPVEPEEALPFIAMSTSPYMIGDYCTYNGHTYRCKMDNTVWSPADYAQAWEQV